MPSSWRDCPTKKTRSSLVQHATMYDRMITGAQVHEMKTKNVRERPRTKKKKQADDDVERTTKEQAYQASAWGTKHEKQQRKAKKSSSTRAREADDDDDDEPSTARWWTRWRGGHDEEEKNVKIIMLCCASKIITSFRGIVWLCYEIVSAQQDWKRLENNYAQLESDPMRCDPNQSRDHLFFPRWVWLCRMVVGLRIGMI